MHAMQTAGKSNNNQQDGASPEVSELLAILAEKERQLADREQLLSDTRQALDNKDHIIREQQKRIALIEEYLRLAKVQRFGSSSEKLPFQADIFDEAELDVALSDLEEQLPEDDDVVRKTRPKKRKRGFSDDLLRVQVHLKLSDEEKQGATKTFFTKVKEELDIVPAQARVLEYWQEKAVFERGGEQHIKAAERPLHPLGKCMASTSLLAHIVTSKYADALPLYRLETILQRYGGSVTRTAMANWIIRLDDVFKPLMNLMREHQLEGDYLQADETRLQVLKETGKVATSDKWMWLIRGGPPGQPAVLFEYDASRSEEVPLRLLDGFEGVLQTDGYAGYNQEMFAYEPHKFAIEVCVLREHRRNGVGSMLYDEVMAALEPFAPRVLRADAYETITCAWLSLTTLAGLALNALLGWWWADPVAALCLVPLIVREGLEGLRGECCGCEDESRDRSP